MGKTPRVTAPPTQVYDTPIYMTTCGSPACVSARAGKEGKEAHSRFSVTRVVPPAWKGKGNSRKWLLQMCCDECGYNVSKYVSSLQDYPVPVCSMTFRMVDPPWEIKWRDADAAKRVFANTAFSLSPSTARNDHSLLSCLRWMDGNVEWTKGFTLAHLDTELALRWPNPATRRNAVKAFRHFLSLPRGHVCLVDGPAIYSKSVASALLWEWLRDAYARMTTDMCTAMEARERRMVGISEIDDANPRPSDEDIWVNFNKVNAGVCIDTTQRRLCSVVTGCVQVHPEFLNVGMRCALIFWSLLLGPPLTHPATPLVKVLVPTLRVKDYTSLVHEGPKSRELKDHNFITKELTELHLHVRKVDKGGVTVVHLSAEATCLLRVMFDGRTKYSSGLYVENAFWPAESEPACGRHLNRSIGALFGDMGLNCVYDMRRRSSTLAGVLFCQHKLSARQLDEFSALQGHLSSTLLTTYAQLHEYGKVKLALKGRQLV